VEHPYYGVRPEGGPPFVLGPEHAGGSNGLCAQSKNKLPVSLKSCAPECVIGAQIGNSSGANGQPLSEAGTLTRKSPCALSGVKRIWRLRCEMSAYHPKRTSRWHA